MPLFGKDAKLYWSTDAKTSNSDASGLTWTEVTNVTDLTDDFTAEEIDTTTRATAALGWNSTARGPKSGNITFGMIIELDDDFAQAALQAFLNSTPLTLMDLTGADDVSGNFGLAANFSVGMTIEKPVKGVQTANVSLSVESYPEWVEVA